MNLSELDAIRLIKIVIKAINFLSLQFPFAKEAGPDVDYVLGAG